MKALPGRPPVPITRVRAVLHGAYSSRSNPIVRELMAGAPHARVVEGQYTLAELIAIENRIHRSPVRIPGITGVGTSIVRNRVLVGFEDTTAALNAIPIIQSIGVPAEAIRVEVWGRFIPSSEGHFQFLRSRPTRAGLQIMVQLPTYGDPAYGLYGSHGYNVRSATGANYFMIASHVVNGLRGINGSTGDTVFQPFRAELQPSFGGPIGVITVNPPWQSSFCGTHPGTGMPFDFCTASDVALGTFTGSATGERSVAISEYEGHNGASGTMEIGGFYAIRGAAPPELLMTNCCGIHKSGRTTGTTTGELIAPVSQAYGEVEWGLGSTRSIWYDNVARVAHAGCGRGDSGGPVFARKVRSEEYYALGIQVACGPSISPSTNKCEEGTSCTFHFIRWNEIEAAFGFTLNPATSQSSSPPPPPPPGSSFPVSIDGPTQIPPGGTCTWYAVTGGGTGPYTYQWTSNGSPVGGNDYFFTGSKPVGSSGTSFLLKVVVTDAGNGQGEQEITVTEDSSAQMCAF